MTAATANDTFIVQSGGNLNINDVQLGSRSSIIDNGGSVTLDAMSGSHDDGTIQINSGGLYLGTPAFLGPKEHIQLSGGAVMIIAAPYSHSPSANYNGINPGVRS